MLMMDIAILIPALFGWLAGLFINYVADVLPLTRRFSQPVCMHCQSPFSWKDYLTLRTCQNCGRMRSLRTWLVQILTTASFVYFWLYPSKALGIPLGMIVLVYFGIITVIDLEHRLILHPTSLVGAALGLLVGTLIHSRANGLLAGIGLSLLGGVFGFGLMYLLYQFGTLVARFRARKMQAAGQVEDEEEALAAAMSIWPACWVSCWAGRSSGTRWSWGFSWAALSVCCFSWPWWPAAAMQAMR